MCIFTLIPSVWVFKIQVWDNKPIKEAGRKFEQPLKRNKIQSLNGKSGKPYEECIDGVTFTTFEN